MLKRLNTLWVGDHLGYLEKLCLVSAAAVGHPVTLYSYAPDNLKGVPDGIEVRDAREVMPEKKLVSYANGSFALGANFFRHELLARNFGYWIDADLYFLKPVEFNEEYVFGWEHGNTINNAILLLPSDSQMVRDLCDLPELVKRPPWFGLRRSLAYYKKRVKGPLKMQDYTWGTFGPQMLDYLAKKYKVADLGQRPAVFYPVKWQEVRSLYGPADKIVKILSPETRTIHLYNSQLAELKKMPPPPGSYIDVICRKHGIDTGGAA
jgi:hypothetical protein